MTAQLSVRVPERVVWWITAVALRRNISTAAVVRELLVDAYERREQ